MNHFFTSVLTSILLSTNFAFSIAPDGLFSKYPNNYFVETGSHHGNGIKLALKAHFKNIYSIELNSSLFDLCSAKFQTYQNVHLFLGDSSKVLEEVISDIAEPITFWLDGHYSGPKTSKGEKFSPILEELEQIKIHPIKNHTIIIDDVRLMSGKYFDSVSLDQIKQFILTMNPKYKFILHDGYIEKDILIAYL